MDEPSPLSIYGASKLAGEVAVQEVDPRALIVRTAWVFGPAGLNFPLKVLDAAKRNGELFVVDDERGSPTYTLDLARGIMDLLNASRSGGLFHVAGTGVASRHELAVEVLRLAGLDVPVHRVKTADILTKARRPKNSVLDSSKAASLGVVMPDWHDALARFMSDVGLSGS